MNAHEAATPAAIMSANGWNPNATAREAIIGYIMEAVAVFDVISVKKVTRVTTIIITTSICTPFNPDNWDPIQTDSSELTNPAAIARPPPNNKRMPHGNLTAVFQSIRWSLSC